MPSYGRVVWPRGLATDGLIGSAVPAADWLGVICKLAFPATPFCIRFAAVAVDGQAKVPLTRDGHFRGGTP